MTLPTNIETSLEILRLQQALAGRQEIGLEQTINRVIAVFQRLGVAWALIGAHAVNVFVRPRATVDVDFVVEARRLRAILDGLRDELGELDEVDIGAAIRLRALAVDLIRSDNHPLFRAALERATVHEGVRVPPVEVLAALKFMAAVSPWRNLGDRQQDAADLVRLYQSAGEHFDRAASAELAALVYPGAERDLETMLERIDRGHPIAL